MNPLLHLLQRAEPVTPRLPALAHALSLADKADNHCLSGMATLPVTAGLPALAHALSLADKADNHCLSGMATLQQM
jgi:hypothetical protein